jgi:hypothetical protein
MKGKDLLCDDLGQWSTNRLNSRRPLIMEQIMCRATEQETMDFWALVLTEESGYQTPLIADIEDDHYIIAEDSDERIVVLDEPDYQKAGYKFMELTGWPTPF